MADNNNQEPINNNTTPPTTEPTTEPAAEPKTDDESPGKKQMAAEINRLRSELADRDAKAKDAADEAERKKLEEQGKWQELADKAKAELELERTKHAAEKRRLTLEAKLTGLNPLALRGAIADCPQDADIDAYVADIKNKYKSLFEGVAAFSRGTPQGMPSHGSGTDKSLEDRLKYEDPKDPTGAAAIRAKARAEKAAKGQYG